MSAFVHQHQTFQDRKDYVFGAPAAFPLLYDLQDEESDIDTDYDYKDIKDMALTTGGSRSSVAAAVPIAASQYLELASVQYFPPQGPEGNPLSVYLHGNQGEKSFKVQFGSFVADTREQRNLEGSVTLTTNVPALSATQWFSTRVILSLQIFVKGQHVETVQFGEYTYWNGNSPKVQKRLSPESDDRAVKRSISQPEMNLKGKYGDTPMMTWSHTADESATADMIYPSAGYTTLSGAYTLATQSSRSPFSGYSGAPQSDGAFATPRIPGFPPTPTQNPDSPSLGWNFPNITPMAAFTSPSGSSVPPLNISAANSIPASHAISPISATQNPTLYRSTQVPGGLPTAAGGSYALPNKANLKISGNLDDMALNWSQEEWHARRRLIHFWRRQEGNTIHCGFQPISLKDRAPNSIVISCIFWEEKNECFVTSVDCIYLLEALVGARFTVEEKNRIRRNLEGFRPLTVSKAKSDSENFFKLIMGFPNPKPRNIEKDVKVFPWKILPSALKKIISKYSASYSSTVGAPMDAFSGPKSAPLDSFMSSRHSSSSSSNLSPGSPLDRPMSGHGMMSGLFPSHNEFSSSSPSLPDMYSSFSAGHKGSLDFSEYFSTSATTSPVIPAGSGSSASREERFQDERPLLTHSMEGLGLEHKGGQGQGHGQGHTRSVSATSYASMMHSSRSQAQQQSRFGDDMQFTFQPQSNSVLSAKQLQDQHLQVRMGMLNIPGFQYMNQSGGTSQPQHEGSGSGSGPVSGSGSLPPGAFTLPLLPSGATSDMVGVEDDSSQVEDV